MMMTCTRKTLGCDMMFESCTFIKVHSMEQLGIFGSASSGPIASDLRSLDHHNLARVSYVFWYCAMF